MESIMAKTAVAIDLVYADNERETFRVHAILRDGRLHSPEMYGHLREWSHDGALAIYPGILTDETGENLLYTGEWGHGDSSQVTFRFPNHPLSIGQEVIRTDTDSGVETAYVYRVVSITNLLD
jgi:hypothetical protein